MNALTTKIGVGLFAVFLLATNVHGQERFIVPAEQIDLDSVIHEDPVAARHAYFGKRVEAVRINPSVLMSGEMIELRLLEDTELTVQTKSLESIVPGTWLWKGTVVRPRNAVFPADGSVLTTDQQKALEDDIYSIEMILVDRDPTDSSEATANSESSAPPSSKFASVAPPNYRAVSSSLISDRSYWVSGRVTLPVLRHQYRIEPISSSDGLHVLIELDPRKVFVMPESIGDSESPENKRRRLAYEEFRSQQIEKRETAK